jgi:hypothetical protein
MFPRPFRFLISGLLLAGYFSFVLMTAVCPFGGQAPVHQHAGPIHHQHTPLCGWAHAVGSVFLVALSTAVFVLQRRGVLTFRFFSTPGCLALPSRLGRAPPLPA